MNFNIVTLFPSLIQSYVDQGVLGRAHSQGFVTLQTINPRDFTQDVHKTVDDKPFGGGDGMLMLVEPLKKSIESLKNKNSYVVYLSPQGRLWNNDMAKEWAQFSDITLVCGRYAGVDQRFINEYCDECISIGDFVLTGGELPALCLVDSISRFIPGVLGNRESSSKESFEDNYLLECPQFTRPREILNQKVPEVLLCGDHKMILQFQKQVSIVTTFLKRQDLFNKANISSKELLQSVQELLKLNPEEIKSLGLTLEELTEIIKE